MSVKASSFILSEIINLTLIFIFLFNFLDYQNCPKNGLLLETRLLLRYIRFKHFQIHFLIQYTKLFRKMCSLKPYHYLQKRARIYNNYTFNDIFFGCGFCIRDHLCYEWLQSRTSESLLLVNCDYLTKYHCKVNISFPCDPPPSPPSPPGDPTLRRLPPCVGTVQLTDEATGSDKQRHNMLK